MSYKLRKVPKKELYWVVNKETGKKHSKEGLPKQRAEAQMRALYAAESGYTMKGGMTREQYNELYNIGHRQGKVWGNLDRTRRDMMEVINFLEQDGILNEEDKRRIGPQIIYIKSILREYENVPDRPIHEPTDTKLVKAYDVLADRINELILEESNVDREVAEAEEAARVAVAAEEAAEAARILAEREAAEAEAAARLPAIRQPPEAAPAPQGSPTSPLSPTAQPAPAITPEELAAMRSRTKTGKGKMVGRGIPMNFLQQMAQSAYRGKTKLQIGPFKLLTSTPTLKFYKDGNRIIVAVRGTELTDKVDLLADGLAIIGNLRNSERWKRDEAKLKEVQEKFPKGEYRYTAVGHSLGGAIIDLMLRDKLVQNALSYNPLVEPQELVGNPLHRRIYHKDDPLYQAFGRFIPNVEVRRTAEPFWKYYVQHNLPFGLGELFTLYDRHRIQRFKGGSKLEGGMTFTEFRNWLRAPAAPNEVGARTNADIVGVLTAFLGSLAGSIYGTHELSQQGSGEGAEALTVILGTLLGTAVGGLPLAVMLNAIAGRPPPIGRPAPDRNLDAVVVQNNPLYQQQPREGVTVGPTPARAAQEGLAAARAAAAARTAAAARAAPARAAPARAAPARAAVRNVLAAAAPARAAPARAAPARAAADGDGGPAAGVGDIGPRQEADVGNDRDGDGQPDVRAYGDAVRNPLPEARAAAVAQVMAEPVPPIARNVRVEFAQVRPRTLATEMTGTGREIVFEDQLQELEYSPKKYLAKARANAKKAGYDPKKLKLCKDGVHKLQIETPQDEMVKFGRVGYGDFLIWSFLEQNGKVEKGEAKKRRKAYLKRASNIEGDWEQNDFSPNNLAIKILWNHRPTERR